MFAGMKTGPLFIPLPSAPPGSVLPSLQGKTLVSSAQVLLPCTWIPGSCIYCHVLSCAHVCMHIRSHQEGSKNTPVHKHVCVLPCSENEAIIETKPMQHQCLKKNTPANTACSSSSRLFFCPPSSVMAVCLASKVDQGACTQKSLVASRITTLEAKRGADPLKRSSYSRRQQMQN